MTTHVRNYSFHSHTPTEITTAGDYNVHPMANIVPLDPKTTSLEESIRNTGLIHPIMLYKGDIIDGRRRSIACANIGVSPSVHDIGEDKSINAEELYKIVLAANIRRSVDKGQKAIIAAFQTEKDAHVTMGYTTALEYAKKVWDVSPVVYKKAKYITKHGREYAVEIFNTGFAVVGEKQLSMNKTWEYLKTRTVPEEERVREGNQNFAIGMGMLRANSKAIANVIKDDARMAECYRTLANEFQARADADK